MIELPAPLPTESVPMSWVEAGPPLAGWIVAMTGNRHSDHRLRGESGR